MIVTRWCSLDDLQLGPVLTSPDVRIWAETLELAPATPLQAIIVPVHNAATHIVKTLMLLQANISRQTEIVIVLDHCNDASGDRVREWRDGLQDANISKVTIAVTDSSVYETLADSIGVALSTAPLIIEVQADIFIEEAAFDLKLHEALLRYPDLAIVGGRGVHRFSDAIPRRQNSLSDRLRDMVMMLFTLYYQKRGNYSPSGLELRLTGRTGRLGARIEIPQKPNPKPRAYIGDTVMRGPYAFARDMYLSLGGLDTGKFFLGLDDHDLAARAWSSAQRRAAYVPIVFSSPLAIGATRAMRTDEQLLEKQLLHERSENAFASSGLAQLLKSESPNPKCEVRVLG